MPRGPLPAPEDKRARRNPATFPTTELDGGGPMKAPKLPESSKLHPRTRRWWKRWTLSPQAPQFTITDWGRLEDLALLVDRFFRCEDDSTAKALFAEIRLNEKELGATPEARLRLRWRMLENDRTDEAEEKAGRKGRASRGRKDPRLGLIEGGGG